MTKKKASAPKVRKYKSWLDPYLKERKPGGISERSRIFSYISQYLYGQDRDNRESLRDNEVLAKAYARSVEAQRPKLKWYEKLLAKLGFRRRERPSRDHAISEKALEAWMGRPIDEPISDTRPQFRSSIEAHQHKI